MFAAPLLSARDLSVSIDGQCIVHGLRFRIEAGSWVGLIGPNGSGKTTLLRAIGGVLPYTGRLLLGGRSVRDWPARARARRIAFVRQRPSLAFDFSVRELVQLGRAPHKRWLQPYAHQDHRRVAQALAQVDLSGFEDRSVLSLSGGEMQRALLAQALVQEADLLLLDEPTAHLDVHYQFAFMERVAALVAEGRTVLAVFHDLELAARYAGCLLVLRGDGHLAAAGPPAEVLTPALLARVFRMNARVRRTADDSLTIDYLRPTVVDRR